MSPSSGLQPAIISVDGISKAFHRPVLRDVRFVVERPQSLFLCGPNGAGKSTLLKILSRLLSPDAGTVRIGGRCLRTEPEQVRPRLGVIQHQSMVYPDLTVLENLDFFARLYGLSDRAGRIADLLDRVGLAAFRYDRACVLSRGLLQRLSIARALIHNPEVILADEPFTGLDTASIDALTGLFRDFHARGGTLVLTTHETALGLACADRVLVINKAQIAFDRPADQVDQPRFIKDYLRYVEETA